MKTQIILAVHILLLAALFALAPYGAAAADKPLVIYDRGGKTPSSVANHAMTMAILQRPDYITIPLMLSKDDVVMVYHDFLLHPHTNVSNIFPERSRQDGNYYIIDFTAMELEQLTRRRTDHGNGITGHISRFEDVVRMIDDMNSLLPTQVGLVLELKYPWFHHNENKDISRSAIDLLGSLPNRSSLPVILQCYDPEELKRIHKSMLSDIQMTIILAQRIDGNNGNETMQRLGNSWIPYNYDWLFTRLGLRVLSTYVNTVVLPYPPVIADETLNRFITDSRDLGIKVLFDLTDSPIAERNSNLLGELLGKHSPDGVVLTKPAVFYSYQKTQVNQQANVNQGTNSTIISVDPMELSKRLEQMKKGQ